MGLEQEWPGLMRIRCCDILIITTFLSYFKQNTIPFKRIKIQRYLRVKQLNEGLGRCFTLAMITLSILAILIYLSKWDRLRFRYATEIILTVCSMGTKKKWLFAQVEWLHKVQKTSLLPSEFAIKYIIFVTKQVLEYPFKCQVF